MRLSRRACARRAYPEEGKEGFLCVCVSVVCGIVVGHLHVLSASPLSPPIRRGKDRRPDGPDEDHRGPPGDAPARPTATSRGVPEAGKRPRCSLVGGSLSSGGAACRHHGDHQLRSKYREMQRRIAIRVVKNHRLTRVL